VAATAVAVGGSWVGLQPLLAAAAAQRPPSLSASQLREAAMPTPTPTPTASPTPTATTTPPSVPPSAAPTPDSRWREVPDSRYLERTFVLEGGEVVIRASRSRVHVTSHTANPGYEVTVHRWARNSVIVSFESPEHNSRLWVMWRDGPYAEITETA
jgi:hypothetical protein